MSDRVLLKAQDFGETHAAEQLNVEDLLDGGLEFQHAADATGVRSTTATPHLSSSRRSASGTPSIAEVWRIFDSPINAYCPRQCQSAGETGQLRERLPLPSLGRRARAARFRIPAPTASRRCQRGEWGIESPRVTNSPEATSITQPP